MFVLARKLLESAIFMLPPGPDSCRRNIREVIGIGNLGRHGLSADRCAIRLKRSWNFAWEDVKLILRQLCYSVSR